jgi:hypothetical protein
MKAQAVRRFHVKTRAKPNRPGTWNSTVVTVFDGDTQVGEYERNYPSFAVETFEPFEKDGVWYALYSPNYTCTRVMSLPNCKDIGGEEPRSSGFCPVELFVPRFREATTTNTGDPKYKHTNWLFESDADAFRELEANIKSGLRTSLGPWCTLDVAFVAGCVWGDDSSWKLQVFDLSSVAEGKLTRSDRFGFVQLAQMPLAEAVRCHRWDDSSTRVTIIRQEDRDLQTGGLVDPYE